MTKPVIGLIGGIGSGKSLVAEELVKHGGYLISGDKLGHDALKQPEIKNRIIGRWEKGIVDDQGEVDRKKLGAVVFADPAELQALESFVFPWIEKGMFEEISAVQKNPKVAFVVVDAAIMLEAGWNKHCDKLVYVDAPRDLRLARLARQRGWTEKELAVREKVQWPLAKKKELADFVIDNSGSKEETARQVAELVSKLGTGK